MKRRTFLAAFPGIAKAAPAINWRDRLGIMCQLGASEKTAREVLAAAGAAGFSRAQINFSWDKVDGAFLKGLPSWLREEGLQCDVLSAYVNCLDPAVVLMNTRAEDFVRAIAYAAEAGASRLVGWTGSYNANLMQADPRNAGRDSEDRIVKFIEAHLKRLEDARLGLALETYITLACPDAKSLKKLLDRLPIQVGAVLDPPNLTPLSQFGKRDKALTDMVERLRGRIGVVHLKDFRLAKDGRSYVLPGPLAGELNYPLFASRIAELPGTIPVIAEHIGPAEFASTRRKLLALFSS